MIRNTLCLLVSLYLLSVALSIGAEDTPTITVSKGDRIALNISGLTGAEGATATKPALTSAPATINFMTFTATPALSYVVDGREPSARGTAALPRATVSCRATLILLYRGALRR